MRTQQQSHRYWAKRVQHESYRTIGGSTVNLTPRNVSCRVGFFRNPGDLVLPVLLVLLMVSPVTAKNKDDVVVLKNGDRLTGEIKKVQRGTLFFKPGYALDTIEIDWAKVEQLESRDHFNVGLTDGTVHSGLIRKAPASDDFTISDGGTVVRVLRTEVIRVLPTENSRWRQMTGSVDYGFTFASDNGQVQSSLGANATYAGERNGFALSLGSSLNTQSSGPNTSRQSFTLDYTRLVSENWFATLLTNLLSSSQQQLDLRSTLGGGFGRTLIRTERTRASAFGGLVFSREKYSPEVGVEPLGTSSEALLGLELLRFRFNEFDLNTRLLVYPSLTTLARVRLSSESNISWKFVKDLRWNLRIYENFDSHPPIIAPKNDFGVTTSIGWTF